MRRVIVLRGLPGSGKSYKAVRIAAQGKWLTDDYVLSNNDFWSMEGGVYRPPSSNDRVLWQAAQEYTRLRCLRAMRQGIDPIVIDNCNTRQQQWAQYDELAEQYGYVLDTMVMPGHGSAREIESNLEQWCARGVHGVDMQTMRRMAGRWEP